jgi:ATP:corrinoid adenosyltransferase
MFAIRNYIRNRWSQGNLKTDWIVAFPKSRILDVNDKNLPRTRIIDKYDLPNILSNIKSNIDALESQAPSSPKWVEAVIQHLSPIAASKVDREAVLEGNFDYIKTLTHERARLLDQISENNRYYVRGPAGSGKSWLAFEQAKKWASEGLKVGIVAFNKGITTYMQNKVLELEENDRPAWVGTFHNFANLIGTTAGTPGKYDEENDVYAESLINAAQNLDNGSKFDAFVVDEAQDFMASWWKTLEMALREPEKGKLALFGDDQQKIFGKRKGPEGFFARLSLDDNVRNSRQIGELAQQFTSRGMTIRGPNSFEIEFIECPESKVISKADDVVERMTDKENWQPGEIALLTTKERHPVHAEYSSKRREEYWYRFWIGDSVFYGTVGGFKGLERPVVVLALNGFHNAEDLEDFLYVGFTRARDKLVVIGDKEIISKIRKVKSTDSRDLKQSS